MKKLADGILIIAVVSVIIGIVSRLTWTPVRGIAAKEFLQFSVFCTLFAIALFLREAK